MKYEINEETIAMIPINENMTKIIEVSKEYDIPQGTFEILEENCEYYGSTYNGRIKSAQKILNYSYKLPLLVEETEQLIFFPTKSSSSEDCCWINHNYVKTREKIGNKTRVTFENGTQKEFNISKLSFKNQLLRAGMLDAIISKRVKKK